MPLYEYRCTKCGHTFDKIQSFKSEPERECPKCGGPLVRPLSAPALQFKGGGWYVNDYAGGRSSATISGDSGAASESKPAESKPAEAKPAAAESSAPASTPAAASSSASAAS